MDAFPWLVIIYITRTKFRQDKQRQRNSLLWMPIFIFFDSFSMARKNLERGLKTGYVFSPAVQQLQHGLSIVNLTNGQQNERHTQKWKSPILQILYSWFYFTYFFCVHIFLLK